MASPHPSPPDDLPLATRVVPYADRVTLRGITVDRDGGTLRVRIPPTTWLAGDRVTVGRAAAVVGFCSVIAVFAAFGGVVLAGIAFVGSFVFFATIMFFVIMRARHMAPGTEVELTPDVLKVVVHDADGNLEVVRHRSAITELRYNPYDGGLLVRAPGQELVTNLLAQEDRRIVEWLADTLNAELRQPPDNPRV